MQNEKQVFIRPKTPKLKNDWVTIVLKILLYAGMFFSLFYVGKLNYNSLFLAIIDPSYTDAFGISLAGYMSSMGNAVLIAMKILLPAILALIYFLFYFLYAKFFATLVFNQLLVFGGEFEEVIVGGAPLNHEVEEFLHKIKFPFTVGYGMTECGPLISYTPWREFIPGSSGRTLPIMETKIDSPDPENIPGEICVKGTNVMKGYYKNPEATETVFDKEGWLHTGDMGTRTPDGTLFLRGRSKTMILSASGQNIYPEEIEAKLNNMPFVAESLVVERDGKLVALVYPDYDALDRIGVAVTDAGSTMENIREELNKLVAPYERIAKIILMPNEFEKTPKRSIKRFLYTH
ncbi:MAG: AMP-binding protein [Muribaculaceae bacterium]|nr:AMP-binding protein [Muribaculaceae bacterium]